MISKPPSRKRPLTADEAELWAFAMRDAKAMRRSRAAERKSSEEEQPETDMSVADPSPKTQRAAADQGRRLDQPVPENVPATPPLARFDERQRRKLTRDTQPIDARLDLHGMRQREAFSALRGFLLASAARGHRNILIITGKGTRAEIERTRDYFIEERGVLRRLVPQWLGEPEFRGIVLSYATAGVRHGGEGALYVRLRKLSRDR